MNCPACNKPIAGIRAMTVDANGLPEPGKVVICSGCGGLGVYGQDLVFRAPTDAELREVMNSLAGTRLKKIQRAVRLGLPLPSPQSLPR